MRQYKIMNEYGNIIEYVWANSEREALCIYLMQHEELNDMMLWKTSNNKWKLAEYDNEDEYIVACIRWGD